MYVGPGERRRTVNRLATDARGGRRGSVPTGRGKRGTSLGTGHFRFPTGVVLAFGSLLILGLRACAPAAEEAGTGDQHGLDPEYAKAFGWGSVIASGKGFPSYTKCDPALFEAQEGAFCVKGGQGAKMDVRALFKEGKTYYELLRDFKKTVARKDLDERVEDSLVFFFWASKAKLYKSGGGFEDVTIPDEKWPKKKGEVPDARYLARTELKCGDNDDPKKKESQFASYALKFYSDMNTDLKNWVWKANPGDKLYVAVYVAFIKKMPEQKRVEADGRVVVPTTTVFDAGAPIATGTIVMK